MFRHNGTFETPAPAIPFAEEFMLPPPRNLSPAVVGRIRRKSRLMWLGVLLFGAIFLLVGLPISLIFFPWHVREDMELRMGRSGIAPGRIASVEETSWSVNHRRVHIFHYTFEAGGEEREGQCYFAGGNYAEGCPIQVRYLVDRPERNCVVGGTFDPAGNVAVFTLIFPLIGIVVVVIGLWMLLAGGRKTLSLARNGFLAEGRVTAVERTSVRINRQYRHRVTVNFDALGPRATTYSAYGPDVDRARRWMETNTPVRVLYDRERPERALVLEFILS